MNWKSILATGLIAGAVTIGAGVFLFWWQSEKSDLTYNSIQSIPFDDISNILFIQQIEIKYAGDKPAEEVVLIISFTDGIIQKSKIIIDNTISHQKMTDDKSIQLKIENLNSGESVNISILYQSSNSESTGAAISLRAKGITGKLIGSSQKDNIGQIVIALIAAYIGIAAITFSTKRGRTIFSLMAKSLVSRRFLGGNQKVVISSILSMYGYPEKAKEYIRFNGDCQYWVEADYLASEAMLGEDKLKNDTIKILIVFSDLPHIARRSKAIIYYNIARLYKSIGSHRIKVEEYLESAKKLDKSEIADRLLHDPIF